MTGEEIVANLKMNIRIQTIYRDSKKRDEEKTTVVQFSLNGLLN